MNDFEGIVRCNFSFGPAFARKDIQIAFDGNSLCLDSQMAEKRDDVQAGRNFPLLAIDRDLHALGPAGAGLVRERKA